MSISRRGFLRGAAIGAGAVAGARLGGSDWVGEAQAQTAETGHLVHIILPGGYNGLFAGVADRFVGKFGTTSTNIKSLGGGVFTDDGTLGTLPDFALQHWAAVGLRHGSTSHLERGAERAILYDGSTSYLNRLAKAMGGNSPLKAVHFGDRMPFGPQPAYQDVSLQRIQDLDAVSNTLGIKTTGVDTSGPSREVAAAGVNAANEISKAHIAKNTRSLTPMSDGYNAAVATLRAPPPPPVSLADIKTEYGVGSAVRSFAGYMAGAEWMIRAGGSNVVNVRDVSPPDPSGVSWDFHSASNGNFTRSAMGRRQIVPVLKKFLGRMLNLPGKNVVVVLSGDFVRLPNGDHGDGTVATVWGKYLKNTVSFGCDGNSRFNTNTPGSKQFWSAMAAAVKSPENPFGANPHSIML